MDSATLKNFTRKIAVASLLFFIFVSSYAQWGGGTFTFEPEQDQYNNIGILHIDTVGNPDNVWHIGQPTKDVFDSAYTAPNCIFTDTSTYYATNDTSSFIIEHIADQGFELLHTVFLRGYYKIDSDTLNDYGMIGFSPDNGITWHNLLEIGNMDAWINKVPVFSGMVDEWTLFEIDMAWAFYSYDFDIGDTVLYKFTFISDSVQNNREGWLIDNITIEDWAEGIEQYSADSFQSVVYPNPASDQLYIEFLVEGYHEYHLLVFDTAGKLVHNKRFESDGLLLLEKESIGGPGSYLYYIFTKDHKQHSTGKFVFN